ncbi:MAG: hypothetical protein ABI354_02430 [Candidatus Saccharimonadales bacterium]
MKSYNGFSSNERARVGNLLLIAIRAGEFPAPMQCELCLQTTGQMQLHNEDYSKPFDDAHPICRSCHGALHIRFTKPARWESRKEIITQLRRESGGSTNGDNWWDKLTNEPIDINPARNMA